MKFREDSYQIYGFKLQANDFFVSIVKFSSIKNCFILPNQTKLIN